MEKFENDLTSSESSTFKTNLELMLIMKANVLKESVNKWKPADANRSTKTSSTFVNLGNKLFNALDKSANKLNNSTYKKYSNSYDIFMTELRQKHNISDIGFNRISTLCNSLFQNDTSYKNRIIFIINYLLNMSDVEYDLKVFEELNESFARYLNMPYPSTVNDLHKSFKKHWYELVGKKEFNKKIAIGITCGILACSLFAGPFGLALIPGASHATLTALGKSVVRGMAVFNVISVAGSAAIGYVVYKMSNHIDKKKMYSEFINLTQDELSYMLALNITILEYLKKYYTNDCSEYKETISILIEANTEMTKDYFINLNSKNDLKNKINIMLKGFNIINNEI